MRLLDGTRRLTEDHLIELSDELRRIQGRTMRDEDKDVLAAVSGVLIGLAKYLASRPAAAGQTDNLTSLDV